MNNRKKTAARVWRVVLPLLALAWVVFIFSRSGLPGDVSGQQSQQLAAWLSGAEEVLPDTPLEGLLRKLGHLAEYSLLGLLLMLTLRAYTRRVVAYSGWPLLGGLLVATLDEAYQLFVPDRSGQVIDIALDFAGVLAGMALALLALAIRRAVAGRKVPSAATPTPPDKPGEPGA